MNHESKFILKFLLFALSLIAFGFYFNDYLTYGGLKGILHLLIGFALVLIAYGFSRNIDNDLRYIYKKEL